MEVKNIPSILTDTEIGIAFKDNVNNQNLIKAIERIQIDENFNSFIIEFHNAIGKFIW